jgi:hypothetical protein
MGYFDNSKLFDIQGNFDIDMKDMGFNDIDLSFMFDGFTPEKQAETGVYSEYQQANMAKLKETKDKYKKRIEADNKEGKTIYTKEDDYTLMIVFADNSEKAQFLKAVKIPKGEKYIKGEIVLKLAIAGKVSA